MVVPSSSPSSSSSAAASRAAAASDDDSLSRYFDCYNSVVSNSSNVLYKAALKADALCHNSSFMINNNSHHNDSSTTDPSTGGGDAHEIHYLHHSVPNNNNHNNNIINPYCNGTLADRHRSALAASILEDVCHDKRRHDSPLYHKCMDGRKTSSSSVRYWLLHYPRVSSLCCAVLLPCAGLVVLSLLLGLWLAHLEAAAEIQSNDALLEAKFTAKATTTLLPTVTAHLPHVCLQLYQAGQPATTENIRQALYQVKQQNEETTTTTTTTTTESGSTLLNSPESDDNNNITGITTNVFQSPPPPSSDDDDGGDLSSSLQLQTALDRNNNNNNNLATTTTTTTTSLVNATDLAAYLQDCGAAMLAKSSALLDTAIRDALETSTSLSFTWIRCFPGHTGGRQKRGKNIGSNTDGLAALASLTTRHIDLQQITPQAQHDYFTQTWQESQAEWQTILLRELMNTDNSNLSPTQALRQATTQARQLATGGDACELNAAGSAWFWFTIMTTIGYGNQAPVTTGGRALIFTFGFLSIVAFAKILASAGAIVAFLLDDVIHVHRVFRILQRPFWGCVLWATLCYGWLSLLAILTRQWKHDRLQLTNDDDFDFAEGYWFAFITATTVGLGDNFLEPEVVVNRDLWYFFVLVLVAFIFLSAFLTKFTALVELGLATNGNNRRGLVQSLIKDAEHLRKLARLFPDKDESVLEDMVDHAMQQQKQQLRQQQQQQQQLEKEEQEPEQFRETNSTATNIMPVGQV